MMCQLLESKICTMGTKIYTQGSKSGHLDLCGKGLVN